MGAERAAIMGDPVKGRAHRNWWNPKDKNWHWLKCQGFFWSAKQLQFNLYLTRRSRSSKRHHFDSDECLPRVHCRREARRDSKTEDATTGAGDAITEGRGSYMITGSNWWRGHSGTSKAFCKSRWIDCTQRPPLKSQRGNWRYSIALCLRPANIILKQFMQVLI